MKPESGRVAREWLWVGQHTTERGDSFSVMEGPPAPSEKIRVREVLPDQPAPEREKLVCNHCLSSNVSCTGKHCRCADCGEWMSNESAANPAAPSDVNNELVEALSLFILSEKNLDRLGEIDAETLRQIIIHAHHIASDAITKHKAQLKGGNDE